jgi:ribosomal protein L40E
MSHGLVCWKCGASLADYTLPLRRLEECRQCRAQLHVCRMCVEYDTHYAKHCREPTAEEVRVKDQANFCDFFKPRPDAHDVRGQEAAARARAELERLFGK